MLPARTGSCQGWVMLAPEESIIIIFWLCCLGIFSCNLINSWLYMGTKKILSFFSLVPLGSAFRSLQASEVPCKCMRPSRFWFYLISFQINRAGPISMSAEAMVHPNSEPGPKFILSESSQSHSTPLSLRAYRHHQAHRKSLPTVFDRGPAACETSIPSSSTAALILLPVAAVPSIPEHHLSQISAWADHILGCLKRHYKITHGQTRLAFSYHVRMGKGHGLFVVSSEAEGMHGEGEG